MFCNPYKTCFRLDIKKYALCNKEVLQIKFNYIHSVSLKHYVIMNLLDIWDEINVF